MNIKMWVNCSWFVWLTLLIELSNNVSNKIDSILSKTNHLGKREYKWNGEYKWNKGTISVQATFWMIESISHSPSLSYISSSFSDQNCCILRFKLVHYRSNLTTCYIYKRWFLASFHIKFENSRELERKF